MQQSESMHTTRAGEMWIRAAQGHTRRSVKDDALLQPMGPYPLHHLHFDQHWGQWLLNVKLEREVES